MTLISLPPLSHFSERFYEKHYLLEATEDTQQRSGRIQEVDESKSFGDGPSGTPGVNSLPNGAVDESLLVRDDPLVAGEHKKLWLANGGYTLVDTDVYEEVISYSWRKYDNGSGNIYVGSSGNLHPALMPLPLSVCCQRWSSNVPHNPM